MQAALEVTRGHTANENDITAGTNEDAANVLTEDEINNSGETGRSGIDQGRQTHPRVAEYIPVHSPMLLDKRSRKK